MGRFSLGARSSHGPSRADSKSFDPPGHRLSWKYGHRFLPGRHSWQCHHQPTIECFGEFQHYHDTDGDRLLFYLEWWKRRDSDRREHPNTDSVVRIFTPLCQFCSIYRHNHHSRRLHKRPGYLPDGPGDTGQLFIGLWAAGQWFYGPGCGHGQLQLVRRDQHGKGKLRQWRRDLCG